MTRKVVFSSLVLVINCNRLKFIDPDDSPDEMGRTHPKRVGTAIASRLFGARLGHRDGLERMGMGKSEADAMGQS